MLRASSVIRHVRWLVSGLVWADWCWFVVREKYCWLAGLGWLKPTSEQADWWSCPDGHLTVFYMEPKKGLSSCVYGHCPLCQPTTPHHISVGDAQSWMHACWGGAWVGWINCTSKCSHDRIWLHTALANGQSSERWRHVSKGPLHRAHWSWWGQPLFCRLSAVRIFSRTRTQANNLPLFSACAFHMRSLRNSP